MMKSRLLGAACVCFAVFSFNVSAAIISVDWKTAGDNLLTWDTTNGMEWLDLSATTNRSWNDIWSELGVGGEFEGWQMAGTSQLTQFFNAFGGDGYYDGLPATSTNIFDAVASYWGDTLCQDIGCNAGEGWSAFYTGNIYSSPPMQFYVWEGVISDNTINIHNQYSSADTSNPRIGTALVRYTSVVPIPPALWLFGTGLLGLLGVARKKVV